MKRVILSIFLVLLITGCQNVEKIRADKIFKEPIDKAEILLTFKEKQFKGAFEKDETGRIYLTLYSDNLPSPLYFSQGYEEKSVCCEDFKVFAELENSPAYFLFEGFQKLSDGDISAHGKNLSASASFYKAIIDKTTLKIKEIYFPMGSVHFLSNEDTSA